MKALLLSPEACLREGGRGTPALKKVLKGEGGGGGALPSPLKNKLTPQNIFVFGRSPPEHFHKVGAPPSTEHFLKSIIQ